MFSGADYHGNPLQHRNRNRGDHIKTEVTAMNNFDPEIDEIELILYQILESENGRSN